MRISDWSSDVCSSDLYAERLVRESTCTEVEVDGLVQDWHERLEQDFQAARNYKPNKADWLEGAWSGLDIARGFDPRRGKTAVPLETLKEVGLGLTKVQIGRAHV